ncbi:tail fiber domain-containing protein [Pseudomonas fluorescens]|uniref:Peptidase S74 domain-containing protein n=1 Tax=Pseudomonas fluorescens TaxID=294 RepID=A0A5E7D6Y2_PSEFL|nr:tail fiber domain-containing protein [Pseudomonas fluorescens]VVO11881.1 hypothetical protein PS691_03472 [Pseudomonas fluorescens]
MVNRRQLLKLSALGTASFAVPLAYSASKITMAYNTGNPIGSTSPKDLSDNARNLDYLSLGLNPSYPDRKGVPRKSWKGMESEFNADQARRESEFDADQVRRESEFDTDQAERVVEFKQFLSSSGYETPVDYAPGISITRTTQQVRYLGELYRPKDNAIPFVTTTFAADEAKWISNGDSSLRQELASDTGAEMLGCRSPLPSGVPRLVSAKLGDTVSVKDFGAIGDGVYHPVSDWYTKGFSAYRGYANLAAVQVDYPHVKLATDSIDWAAIQAGLDATVGGNLHIPAGTYLITDTLYMSPASTVTGVSTGDNIGISSSIKGSRIKTYGTGVKRIWTDIGLAATSAGTLVDEPVSVAFVFTGSWDTVSFITLEGGELADGSDSFDIGFFNPSVKRTALYRCETMGRFKISGCYIDATWSNTNTALQNLHALTYGRAIPSDQGSNEVTLDTCWLHGGNWGLKVKGTNRTDTSANMWSPGGVSNLSEINNRVDNEPLGISPNFPEDSGGYYRDVHNDFQNRYHTNSRIGSQSAYAVFLDRGRFEQFDAFYGETRPDRCVTSLLRKTVDALGAITKLANGGAEWTGASGTVPTLRWVYLTDNVRIDVLQQKLRIGAVMTTATGSLVVRGVGFDASAGRAYVISEIITGAITKGQTLTQAAGQTTASGGFYGTDRCGSVITSGQSDFTVVGGLSASFGATATARYLRLAGLVSTVSDHIVTATNEVSINCDTSQMNLYLNRYGTGAIATARLRFQGTSLETYQAADLGSTIRRWGTVFAQTGAINTSDANHKTAVRKLSSSELAASKELGAEFGLYKFLDAVSLKGVDAAREHCGMTVQRAVEIMERNDLDPFNYSFICYDKWEDEYEDVEGVSTLVTPAGEIFSFRMEGLLAFIAKGFEQRLSALEAAQ